MKRRFFLFLEENFMRFFRFLSKIIPNAWIAPLGKTFGSIFFNLFLPIKHRIVTQLGEIFPEKSPEEIKQLFQGVARNGGRVLMEQLMVNKKMIEAIVEETVGIDAAYNILKDNYAQGKGLIIVTSHLGNWEQLIALHTYLGFKVSIVWARMPSRYIDGLATKLRHRVLKCDFIYKKQSRYFIKNILAQNSGVGFAIDVDHGQRGVLVPFMGRHLSVGWGAAYYALNNNVPMIFVIYYRDEKDTPHVFMEEIKIDPTGDMDTDVYNLTALLAGRIEHWVRRYPDQWFGWIQEPWRTKPLEALEEGLAKDPDNTKIMVEIGRFYLVKERREAAREIFQKAIRVNPKCQPAYLELGRLLMEDGAGDDAVYNLYRALEIRPGDITTLKVLGHYFLKQALYTSALTYYRRALRARFDDPEAYWGKGQCLEKLGKPGKALAAYKKGIKIYYDYPPLHQAMANHYAADRDKRKQLEEHLWALRILQAAPEEELLVNMERTWGKEAADEILSSSATRAG